MKIIILSLLLVLLVGCTTMVEPELDDGIIENEADNVATFAGGCFWCMEAAFEGALGIETISGYTGGDKINPSYSQVTSGNTGHFEAVQLEFNKSKVTYVELLDIFWNNIDPFDKYGQFADKGSQYKTAIFYHNEEQKELAEKSKLDLEEKFGKTIATEILPAKEFFEAEEYHQDYYKKQSSSYERYKKGSGRVSKLQEIQDELREKEIREKLDPTQYHITQEGGTEKPFENEYWNNSEEGIYVDIVSGEPLFSSKDKYDSGTGWPSFTKPLEEENVMEKEDNTFFMKRTEVKSRLGDSHLGHVFTDGPVEEGGMRYCLNSAALKFIPKEDLEKEGYEDYLFLFE